MEKIFFVFSFAVKAGKCLWFLEVALVTLKEFRKAIGTLD
jgi:hypothetical protein